MGSVYSPGILNNRADVTEEEMKSIKEQITRIFTLFIYTNKNDNGVLIKLDGECYKKFLFNGLYKRRRKCK
ncbi:MAG TPA: hypothetical protein DCP51_09020 [Clostridiales bacterium]|nr:hypothetical protein [Clostridiales bacterium]